MPLATTYADRRPSALPRVLTDLTGPEGGVVELPTAAGWTGRRRYDLDDPADGRVFYERVIVEASDAATVARLLDRRRLLRLWPELFLPAQVRARWQERFPELTGELDHVG
ncbi:MAG: hypothetical protein ACRCY8_10375 [Dermatophilaceae bacterium]